MAQQVTIIGAGIVGLYTALVLLCTGKFKVTVYAKHLPGDSSPEYCSPYAGGNFSQTSGSDPAALEFDRQSYPELIRIVEKYGEQAGIKQLPSREYSDAPLSEAKIKSCESYVRDFKLITDAKELEAVGVKTGCEYMGINFNSPKFLKWLYGHLQQLGVTFIRREIKDLSEVTGPNPVFNCTGLTSYKLTGDNSTYPVRGQIVVVKAPHVQRNYRLIKAGQPPTYIIPRPESGGSVVLGGYYEENNFDSSTYSDQTRAIIDRATRLCPELVKNGPLEIIDEKAGFRPGRKGGARIEKEYINGNIIIHNYGAGSTGYQSGIGMALKAVSLLVPKPRL